MTFFTAINCMDGRVQLPVIRYLQKRFNVKYVDSITEPGPNLILANNIDLFAQRSIFERLKISIENHNSKGIAIVGHHDCAGNPAPKADQIDHLKQSIQQLQLRYKTMPIIGLWVDQNWEVHEIIKT